MTDGSKARHVYVVSHRANAQREWTIVVFEQQTDAQLYALRIRADLHVLPLLTSAPFIATAKAGKPKASRE